MGLTSFIKKLIMADVLFSAPRRKVTGVYDKGSYLSDTDVVFDSVTSTITFSNQATLPSWMEPCKYFRFYDGSLKITTSSQASTYIANVVLIPNIATNEGIKFKILSVEDNIITLDTSEANCVDRTISGSAFVFDGRIAMATNDPSICRINSAGATVFDLQHMASTGDPDGSGIALAFADHMHLDIDPSPETDTPTSPLTILKACAESASIGDIIMDSTSLSNGVETVVNNTEVRPAYGIILSKPTTTTCTVLQHGEYSIGAGLTDGQKVFLSTSGSITSTPPVTGYLQCLGIAIETSKISFNPHLVRVKRS